MKGHEPIGYKGFSMDYILSVVTQYINKEASSVEIVLQTGSIEGVLAERKSRIKCMIDSCKILHVSCEVGACTFPQGTRGDRQDKLVVTNRGKRDECHCLFILKKY